MAVEDAYILSSLLARMKTSEQLEAAFKAYDGIRRQRGLDLVTTSAEAGTIWELEHPSIGEDVDKLREHASTRMRWIWEEDLEAEVENGLKLMASV